MCIFTSMIRLTLFVIQYTLDSYILTLIIVLFKLNKCYTNYLYIFGNSSPYDHR